MKETDAMSLPKGWKTKKLGEVCEKTNNIKWANNERELEYIDLSSVSREKLVVTKSEKITKFNAPSRAKKIVLEKDVIFATTRPTLKRVAIINRQYINQICSTGFCILRPKEIVEEKWIFSFIQTDEFMNRMEKLQRGASYPAVTDSDVKNTLIPIPPLPEQKRIVSILDRAFEAIDKAKANAEQNLKNAKELFESYLQGVFENKGDDWEEKKLNEISENLDSKRIPITKKDRKTGNIPYYGASGIVDYVNNYIFNENLLCISEDGANLLARTYPIAFSINGKSWVNNHAHILRFNDIITQQFVELYLNSIKLDNFISGMAQPKLNQTKLNLIPIPLPPLHEQQQIVQKLDALSAETKKLESIYQKKISDLEELKKSILKKAFEGEL